MVVCPSVSASPLGRFLGRLYDTRVGVPVLNLANLFLVLSIPIAIALYLWTVLPGVGTRYRITNRRVIVERGLKDKEVRSLRLDQFDRMVIEQLPGQRWFRSADLIFYDGQQEVFRLAGVPYPDVFRAACQKASMTYRGVQEVLARQAVSS